MTIPSQQNQDSTGDEDLTSGISGQTLSSPGCPGPSSLESPCPDLPVEATVIVKTADGSDELIRFTSSSDGAFTVRLAPNTYLLEPLRGGGAYPAPPPAQVVEVKPDEFTEVLI